MTIENTVLPPHDIAAEEALLASILRSTKRNMMKCYVGFRLTFIMNLTRSYGRPSKHLQGHKLQ